MWKIHCWFEQQKKINRLIETFIFKKKEHNFLGEMISGGTKDIWVFNKWNKFTEFRESGKSLEQESGQFKYPLFQFFAISYLADSARSAR